MSKHSPGPWKWSKEIPRDNELPVLLDASDQVVCGFGNAAQYYPTEGLPPNVADARLIEKAPQLLAMLKRAAEDREPWHWDAVALIREIEEGTGG